MIILNRQSTENIQKDILSMVETKLNMIAVKKCSHISHLEVGVRCRAELFEILCVFWHSCTRILSEIFDTSSFSPRHSFFLWTLWIFRGERATSDISSWAHLINKWINYARFMGWCTSKHFKGHAECPWGAVMRGSSTQRQIWWPRFLWTWSFSHFVCARSFRSLALCLLCFSCFLSQSFFSPFFPSQSLISFHLLHCSPQISSHWSSLYFSWVEI